MARFLPAWGLLVFSLVGCSGPPTVTGTVVYRSRPLESGQIAFIAADGTSASGTINPDGSYVVANAPRGPVTAVVLATIVGSGPGGQGGATLGRPLTAPPRSAIPTRYNDPTTSGLKYTLDARNQRIDIELTD